MVILDKFLAFMKLNDEEEYDYDTDIFDDDDEEFAEPEGKTSFVSDGKKKNGTMFDEKKSKSSFSSASSKVTPIRQSNKRGNNMEVCVIKPTQVNEAREITETFLEGRTIIMNLEGLDIDIAQRIVDFVSGAAIAVDGNLQMISKYIVLVTPSNVDISGDIQDILSATFDVSSFR